MARKRVNAEDEWVRGVDDHHENYENVVKHGRDRDDEKNIKQ